MAYNPEITAFGETKKAKEWAMDSRCVVKASTLCDRIVNLNWSPEESMSVVTQQKKVYPKNYFNKGAKFWYFISTGVKKKIGSKYCVECVCVCGEKRFIATGALARGSNKSCGCKKGEGTGNGNKTHGLSRYNGKGKHPLYSIWCNVKDRCTNKNSTPYKDYGGRGIVIEFVDFQDFYNWAINNGWENGLSLERKDVNKNYSRENCTWIPMYKQSRNKRTTYWVTAFGETKSIMDWIEDTNCGLTYIEFYKAVKFKKINPEVVILAKTWHQINHP